MTVREPSKVLVAGDWHGNVAWARRTIEWAKFEGADTIVQAGDFGFWTPGRFTADFLAGVHAAAERHHVHVFWIDGNHEDHSRRAEFGGANTPWLTYLPRGQRWQWWGKTWMALGGAVSVDKEFRTLGVDWWPQEELTDSDVEHACRPGRVDVVIAHDCPKGVSIPGIGADTKSGTAGWPRHVLLQAAEHRAKLAAVWAALGPRLWVHGHYHVAYQHRVGATLFVGLGCDGDSMANANCFIDRGDI